jgi:cytochrome c5
MCACSSLTKDRCVKKVIRKFLSKKRNIVVLAILLLIVASLATYTLIGISKSLQAMADAKETTPYYPDYPVVDTKGKNGELIKRGEYLAKAGDCIACHTNAPEKGKPFAGGLPMKTPFGTVYSPNITPDKETGIGKWTEAQFIKAMTRGISPSGHYYYPAFPYLYFNKITPSDLKALKAYFDSIPAVSQTNRKNEMVWPFNQRLLQLPWRILFFHPQKNTNMLKLGTLKGVNPTDQMLRGAYLVEGLGHCAMCHSPSYHIFSDKLSLGAPIRTYDLTGAKVAGYLAPNITKINFAKTSVDEIIDVFLKDRLVGGGKVEGPMLEVNHDSLKHLTRADLEAIAVYLKNVQTKMPPKPKTSGGPGAATYESYCSGCHATGAGGAPKFGDPAAWDPLVKNGIDKIYSNAIKGVGGMPAKGTCLSCSDDEIKQTVDYMIAATKGGTSQSMVNIPMPKPLTMADGQRIYEKNCSTCHNTGKAIKPGNMTAWKPIIDAGFLDTYHNVVTGQKGHPIHGGCPTCTDADIKAAVKYMMQKSTTTKDFSLW